MLNTNSSKNSFNNYDESIEAKSLEIFSLITKQCLDEERNSNNSYISLKEVEECIIKSFSNRT